MNFFLIRTIISRTFYVWIMLVLTGLTLTRAQNSAPTDILLSLNSINENNGPGSQVGGLSSTDVDSGDTHTYSLISGVGDSGNLAFMIVSNILVAANFLNHEVKERYSVRIRTDDGNGGTFEKVFEILVNDINEAPSDIALSNNEIDETDADFTLVGSLFSNDEDDGETLEYTLVEGAGDDNNELFRIDQNQLRTSAPIDFETDAELSVRLRVTDSGGLFFDKPFSITINNIVNEQLRVFDKDRAGSRVKNFFSPNGDGENDFWVIEDILDNPTNEVKVYSQGGKLLFQKQNYQNTWDGTSEGKNLPSGTYYYEINVYNQQSVVRGFLTIIREN
jgi:gliding motility-associated-like protein